MPAVRLVVSALALSTAVLARSQAITDPNQIVGTLRIRSANPAVQRVIRATNGTQGYEWHEGADSADLPQELSHWADQPAATRETVDYEVTVESSAAGIAYDVTPNVATPAGASRYYRFSKQQTAPVLREPAPNVRLDFTECAGVFHVRWTDAAGNPLPVEWGRAEAYPEIPRGSGVFPRSAAQARERVENGDTSLDLLARGDGGLYEIVIDYTIGTDAFHDTVTYRKTFNRTLQCDEVVNLACSGGDLGGPCYLGRIIGRADLVGIDELPLRSSPGWIYWSTMLSAVGGPFGNSRYDFLDRTPSSGAFELENLMPSVATVPATPYQLVTRFGFSTRFGFEDLQMPRLYVPVGCGETVDLAGALATEPGWLHGRMRLAGPPPDPMFGSPLDDIRRVSDPDEDGDGDGIPDEGAYAFLGLSSVGGTGGSVSGTSSPQAGEAAVDFTGSADGGRAEFDGEYEMALATIDSLPSDWAAPSLRLRLVNHGTSDIPLSYQDSDLRVRPGTASLPSRTTIVPGSVEEHDLNYCFSQVNLAYLSTAGTFFAPRLDGDASSGGFDGIDAFGVDTQYHAWLTAQGTPLDSAHAATQGLVVMALPEGSYELAPRVTSVNPGGGTSETALPHVAVRVGCRQVIDLFPDFGIEVGALPPCTEAGFVTVAGRATGSADVTRITCAVNGGAPLVVCTGCGVGPTFVTDVPLDGADATVVISAEATDGRSASVTAFTRGALEPSAGNRRPGSAPLRITRTGPGDLRLAWEDQPGRGANIYAGTIASLRDQRRYDHAGIGACDLTGGTASITPPAGSAYFLVASTCGWGDSSLGRDSLGRERPAAFARCR